jgi:hypothetical protein
MEAGEGTYETSSTRSQDSNGSMGIFYGDMEEAGASYSGHCSVLVLVPVLCGTNLPHRTGWRDGTSDWNLYSGLKEIHAGLGLTLNLASARKLGLHAFGELFPPSIFPSLD